MSVVTVQQVEAYQRDSRVHPLTCANEHGPLVPYQDKIVGETRLKCSKCRYRQGVPPHVVDAIEMLHGP